MFSGIIDGIGEVVERSTREGGVFLRLRVPERYRGLSPGTSVAVNGVCLTVVETTEDSLAFDAVGATLRRTRLGEVSPGDRLNLERSLKAGAPVDGHFVMGHVDGLGIVRSLRPGEGAVFFDIEVSGELLPQIVPRGSIAVDGVSLTVAGVQGAVFTVSIVPYTLRETIFGDYEEGTPVHLETDVLAKYVQGARETDAAGIRLGDTETAV
jgi:riboflavin synthase